MSGYFSKIKDAFITIFVSNAFTKNGEADEKKYASVFSEGKNFSDFVGMIVRYAFCCVCVLTLFKGFQDNTIHWVFRTVYLYTAIIFFAFSIYLLLRISLIVFLYQTREAAGSESTRKHVAKIAFASFIALSLMLSVNYLADTFTEARTNPEKTPRSSEGAAQK